jgi:hypothetical protein
MFKFVSVRRLFLPSPCILALQRFNVQTFDVRNNFRIAKISTRRPQWWDCELYFSCCEIMNLLSDYSYRPDCSSNGQRLWFTTSHLPHMRKIAANFLCWRSLAAAGDGTGFRVYFIPRVHPRSIIEIRMLFLIFWSHLWTNFPLFLHECSYCMNYINKRELL